MNSVYCCVTAEGIELRIGGADLLLAGRFHHWMPVTLINGKDDEGLAQVLFDVTSNRAAPGRRPARSVRVSCDVGQEHGAAVVQLKGRIKAGIFSGRCRSVAGKPARHTPFFAITFTIDREKFADLWTAFEDRAATAIANGEEELRPWAWLREPQLAAA